MSKSLTLSLGGIMLSLRQFRPGGYSRLPIQDQRGKVTYSLAGAPIVEGAPTEEKHEFVVQCYVTKAEGDAFERLVREQSRLRRTPPYQHYEILMQDEGKLFWEKPARTRARVGSYQMAVDGGVEYFPVFNVMVVTHSFGFEGRYMSLDFTAMELNKVGSAS